MPTEGAAERPQRHSETLTGGNDVIGPSLLFQRRHLPLQNSAQPRFIHVRALQHPLTLEESWSGNDQHSVTLHVSPRLEEQRHVKHDDSSPGQRPATQPDISSLGHVRMHDCL